MVEEDIARWERWLKGEQFPWDAPHRVRISMLFGGKITDLICK